ncbi:MAG: hypothetical protein GC164_05880 [Phycisphaera sp.]|nr:hypothetical protein [Phycisphaera sp.]
MNTHTPNTPQHKPTQTATELAEYRRKQLDLARQGKIAESARFADLARQLRTRLRAPTANPRVAV